MKTVIALGCFIFVMTACNRTTPTLATVMISSPIPTQQPVVTFTKTPSKSNTQQPRPTSTRTLSPVEGPSVSASPTSITSPQSPFRGPLVAFTASDAAGAGYILILDLTTDSTRQFQWTGDVLSMADWWADGCGLNVFLATSSGVELVSTNLKDNESREVFSGGERSDGGYTTWPVLSPDQKWVAYTVLSGQQEYIGAEFQNIEIVAVENQTRPIVLTKSGGAWKAAWSPDGQDLAYSDYDASGVTQLYRSKPDGSERVPLTHFTVGGIRIGPARWSPLGDKIVFAVYEDTGPGSVWIASADGSEQIKASVNEYYLENR